MDLSTAISKSERSFMLLATMFITLLVLTNLIAGKYFVWFGLPFSCSVLIYSFTFLVTNIVSEIYGLKKAKLLIWSGFIVSMINICFLWIAIKLPIDIHSPIKEATFNHALGLMPDRTFGFMMAYLITQFIGVQIFAYLKKWTAQKYLWLRNNISMLVSQFLDVFIVATFALVIGSILDNNQHTKPIDWELWEKVMLGQYVFRVMLTLLGTPLIYISVYLIKKHCSTISSH